MGREGAGGGGLGNGIEASIVDAAAVSLTRYFGQLDSVVVFSLEALFDLLAHLQFLAPVLHW